jgi:hypothetical protein
MEWIKEWDAELFFLTGENQHNGSIHFRAHTRIAVGALTYERCNHFIAFGTHAAK